MGKKQFEFLVKSNLSTDFDKNTQKRPRALYRNHDLKKLNTNSSKHKIEEGLSYEFSSIKTRVVCFVERSSTQDIGTNKWETSMTFLFALP